MTTAIYAGSFDPFTNGHFDILKNGSEIFDKVIIAVAQNSSKTNLLPLNVRVELIKQCVSELKNVEVDTYEGLTVDYAVKRGANVLLRGLRSASDFDYEIQIAQSNNLVCEKIKTVFLPSNPQNSFISSSIVREILANKGDISKFVPKPVSDFFNNK